MPDPSTTFDIGRLQLKPGEARQVEMAVALPTLKFADEEYALGEAQVTLDIGRMANSGYSLRLRFAGSATGLCMRCLETITMPSEVDAWEIDQPGGGEHLTSPYVDGHDVIDVQSWARDAMALSLPVGMSCREAEACPNFPEPLRAPVEEAPAAPAEPGIDPRWAKLSELSFEDEA